MAATTTSSAGWDSALIPPTIRRPWRVFEEDLEDKVGDASSQGLEVNDETRERLAMVQNRGAPAAFAALPQEQQRTYVEVSLMELSAFVCWRRGQVSRTDGTTKTDFEATWDLLDCEDKGEWVPEDPRAVLAADTAWAPLLADGPPAACGNVPKVAAPQAVKPEPPSTPKAPVVTKTPAKAAPPAVIKREPPAGGAAAPPPKVVKKERTDVPSSTAAPAKAPAAPAKAGASASKPAASTAPADKAAAPKVIIKSEPKDPSAPSAAPAAKVPAAKAPAAKAPAAAATAQPATAPAATAPSKKQKKGSADANKERSVATPARATSAAAAGAETPTAESAPQAAASAPAAVGSAVAGSTTAPAAAEALAKAASRLTAVAAGAKGSASTPAAAVSTSTRPRPQRGAAAGSSSAAAKAAASEFVTPVNRSRRAASSVQSRPVPVDDDSEDEPIVPTETVPVAPAAHAAVPRHARPARIPAHRANLPLGPTGLPMAPANLCPEALDAVCSVCGSGEATDDNDLALCDRCDKAFHQRCHDPPVERFGSIEDQWFCKCCTAELAKMRGFELGEGDFVWARYACDPVLWPARILRIDFSSLADPKPFWVQFYDASQRNEGAWVDEKHVVAWTKGPTFAAIKDAKRRLAARLAEADGAEPLSGAGAQVPVKPVPRAMPTPKRGDEAAAGPPAKRSRAEGAAASPATAPRRRLRSMAVGATAPVPSDASEASAMRKVIDDAKKRQAELEKQLQEAQPKAAAAADPVPSPAAAVAAASTTAGGGPAAVGAEPEAAAQEAAAAEPEAAAAETDAGAAAAAAVAATGAAAEAAAVAETDAGAATAGAVAATGAAAEAAAVAAVATSAAATATAAPAEEADAGGEAAAATAAPAAEAADSAVAATATATAEDSAAAEA